MFVRSLRAGVLGLFCLPIMGCPNQELAPLRPCTESVGRASITQVGTNEVDLLLVVDDSPSMTEEQDALKAGLAQLVRVLTTGDRDEDGEPDFPAVDLHVGVISPNLGGFADPPAINGARQCKDAGLDGALLVPSACAQGFAGASPFAAAVEGAADAAFAERVSCMVDVGDEGCGIEQQLEAALKAVTPSTSQLSFSQGSPKGHADGVNRDFVRDGSLLVVLLVTDEDDCSGPDRSFLSFDDSELGLACAKHADRLYDVQRYVEGLRALRPDQPDLVLFAAITGVPQDLVEDPTNIDYDAILADERMTIRSDGTNYPNPAFACKQAAVGEAGPARRIVEVAQAFGANGLVQSICNADYRGALSALQDKISTLISGPCLPRKLIPDAKGFVDCDVVETLAVGRSCDEVEGRVRLRNEGGREICRVIQVGPKSGAPGWYYDPESNASHCAERAGKVRYTDGFQSLRGTQIDLECLEPVQPSRGRVKNAEAIGLECDADAICEQHEAPDAPEPVSLFCDRESRTCQAACEEDANCPAAMVCDRSQKPARCVSPTCPR
jgi:hypothetical protein